MIGPRRLVRELLKSERCVVLTGAGASAESGIPTFRDPDGHWLKHDPTQLASLNGFRNDPVLVQSWYESRRRALDSVHPNDGHRALAALEGLVQSLVLITQNVDGLHRRAGSKDPIEIHGSIDRLYCVECGSLHDSLAASLDSATPVLCSCGGLIRPDVVWFGEALPIDQLEASMKAATEADVFLAVGTSAEVYPAAALPIIAKEHGAYVAEINTQSTPISRLVNETLIGMAGPTLINLVGELKEARWAESIGEL